MKNRIVLVGILTIVLAVFAVSSAAALPIPPGKNAIVWFDPDPSSGLYGENVTVKLMLNTSVYIYGWADDIYFNPSCVNITKADWTGTPFTNLIGFGHFGNWVRVKGSDPDLCEPTTGEILLITLTLQCKSTSACMSELGHEKGWNSIMVDCDVYDVPTEWVNGTFTCIAPAETFTKPLLVGWNLISLPLTNATDMTVANIMSSVSGNYDALYRYDAMSKSWVSMSSSDTMANGVGYFIHMTSADTWTYTGSAYTSMNAGLSQGLNMAGWLNCSKDITDALSSIEGKYWYVARWNATSQEFETYNPAAPPAFNDFTTMDRSEGYFISMKEAATLTESC